MALALDDLRPQRAALTRAKASRAERRRIARQLHDTLGQSLGYLHLKLDQLSGDHDLEEIQAIRAELERMRDVASEAYEQVRGALTRLQPVQSDEDVTAALLSQARALANQAGFEVQMAAEGQPRPLAPRVRHHILRIFQEALTNVAKHARARNVWINLTWTEDAVTFQLTDDGCGFDRDAIRLDGHYGLSIMEERAREIEGRLTLSSCLVEGTRTTLELSLSPMRQGGYGS